MRRMPAVHGNDGETGGGESVRDESARDPSTNNGDIATTIT
jgi:uncharacterized protein (DUF342 family)